MGAPWSPPAWMKVNNNYTLKSGNVSGQNFGGNAMDVRKEILNNAITFRMEEGYFEAYALCFSKYIQGYHKEGVIIDAIQVKMK